MSYVSREIHTRQRRCTIFTSFLCHTVPQPKVAVLLGCCGYSKVMTMIMLMMMIIIIMIQSGATFQRVVVFYSAAGLTIRVDNEVGIHLVDRVTIY